MTIKALVFSKEQGLRLEDRESLEAGSEAIINVTYAGICSTDLEILKGYVPGYNFVLGHEFVGVVAACSSKPELLGLFAIKTLLGTPGLDTDTPLLNPFTTDAMTCTCSDPDPCFMRNHYPRRTVLGIIGRDGALSQQISIPAANLHIVPEGISDKEAAFAEPLAAACRILEQQVIKQQDRVAVVGDGKLGLLVAQLIAQQTKTAPVHFGRHSSKLDLVQGTKKVVVEKKGEVDDEFKQATGTAAGILMAVALTRPLGTVVQKSTCSIEQEGDDKMPVWSEIANQIVVDEKRLIGSRCGPFEPALQALQSAAIKSLLAGMVSAVYPIDKGIAAFEEAKRKGVLKVLIDMAP